MLFERMMVGEAVAVAVAAMADGEGVAVIFWRVCRSSWHEQKLCCSLRRAIGREIPSNRRSVLSLLDCSSALEILSVDKM